MDQQNSKCQHCGHYATDGLLCWTCWNYENVREQYEHLYAQR